METIFILKFINTSKIHMTHLSGGELIDLSVSIQNFTFLISTSSYQPFKKNIRIKYMLNSIM